MTDVKQYRCRRVVPLVIKEPPKLGELVGWVDLSTKKRSKNKPSVPCLKCKSPKTFSITNSKAYCLSCGAFFVKESPVRPYLIQVAHCFTYSDYSQNIVDRGLKMHKLGIPAATIASSLNMPLAVFHQELSHWRHLVESMEQCISGTTPPEPVKQVSHNCIKCGYHPQARMYRGRHYCHRCELFYVVDPPGDILVTLGKLMLMSYYSQETVDACLLLLDLGTPAAEISKTMDVPTKVIRRWQHFAYSYPNSLKR